MLDLPTQSIRFQCIDDANKQYGVFADNEVTVGTFMYRLGLRLGLGLELGLDEVFTKNDVVVTLICSRMCQFPDT